MVRKKIDIHLETNKVLRLISVHENIFTINRIADELALRLSDVRLCLQILKKAGRVEKRGSWWDIISDEGIGEDEYERIMKKP